MPADDASALLTSPLRRWRQTAFWNVKKAAKKFAGPVYRQAREQLLHHAYHANALHKSQERHEDRPQAEEVASRDLQRI